MSNPSRPKISIVTVNLNNAEGLARTLSSIADQDYPDIESIIIDGASGDDSLEVAHRLKLNTAILVSEPDLGPYDAMNKGVRHASGEIIQFLNSGDVYSHSSVIDRIVPYFARSQIDLVLGDTSFFDSNGKCVRRWRTGEYQKWKFYLGWMPNHPSSFARAELFGRTGPFRTDFRIASDYDMFLRWFLIHDVKAIYHAEELTQMEVGGISNRSLSNIWMASKEVRRSWQDNGLRYGGAAPYAKILRKIPQLLLR